MSRFMDALNAAAEANWQVWWSVIQRIDPEAKAYAEWIESRQELKDETHDNGTPAEWPGEMPQVQYPEFE